MSTFPFGIVMPQHSGWGRPSTPEEEARVLREDFQRIAEQPTLVGHVVRRAGDRVLIAAPGNVFETRVLGRLARVDLRPGTGVRIKPDNFAVLDTCASDGRGVVFTVKRVVDDERCEVTGTDNSVRTVFRGIDVEPGDRVIVEITGSVVIGNLGKPKDGFAPSVEQDVEWDSIGGLERAKRELRDAIETPTRHAATFARYGRRPPRGILLCGPPGTGKTMLGKAAATALRRLHGASGRSGFLYVKGPELLNKWVGSSEQNVRELFVRAREHQRANGFPALVFIDECDAILARRGSGRTSDMERTMVPQFLAEMDGLDESAAIVILATNRPHVLDPAVVRDGRVDRKVMVGRPGEKEATEILAINLRARPLAPGLDVDTAARETCRDVFDGKHVAQTVMVDGAGAINVPLAATCSGAMLYGIVERAAAIAMEREIAGCEPRGISGADLSAAVRDAAEQYRHVDLGDDVREYVETFVHSSAAAMTPPKRTRRVT